MYLKRSIDSITYIPEISELTDNSDRLYNIGGNLYFNGTAIGSGSGDSSNDWVNSNDYATYATLINSINVSSAAITGNIYNTWKTVNTSIDTVQGNVSTGVANTFNTYTTLNTSINTVQNNVATGVANTFNTYTALNTNINTVQDNVAIGVANTYNTYATLNTSIDIAQNTITANVYNTWASLDLRIEALDAGSNTSVADLIGGIVGANTNIDTVQSNLTSSIASINTVQNNVTTGVANTFNTYTILTTNTYNTWKTVNTAIDSVQSNLSSIPNSAANDYNTYTTLAANDYNTYNTLNSRINSVQGNLGVGISATAIVPPTDGIGYIGNSAYTWSAGHFVDLILDNNISIAGTATIEGNLIVRGNVVSISVQELAVEDNIIHLNANSTITNPDIGFVGNYNEGTYAHAGFFRDATDGVFKVFEHYTPEPNESPFINTNHVSFSLASIQANTVFGNLVGAIATVNSIDLLANDGATLLTARSNDWNTLLTAQSNDLSTYTTLSGFINTVQSNVTSLSTNIDLVQGNSTTIVANTFNTYATLNTSIDIVQSNLTSNVTTLTANDGATLLTARSNDWNTLLTARSNDWNTLLTAQSNDWNTYTTLNGLINTVQGNVTTVVANNFNTYATLNTSIAIVQGNVTSNVTTLTANDGTTLLTARSNDWNTLLTTQSNDWNTLLTARSNDFSTYTTLNGLINTVQSNLSSASGGVWTEDAGRAYYVGKVVVNSDVVQGEQFYVNGNAKVTSDFEVGGTLTESSSVRLKENIAPLDDQLNKLMLLRPVEYDKILSKSHEYGLIAEEVANVIPEVVSEGSSSIQYTRLIPTLIKAIQELTEKVNKLESK